MHKNKGLNLVDRVHEELWIKVCNIVQEVVTKTIPRKKKKCNKANCLRRLYKYLRKEEKSKAKDPFSSGVHSVRSLHHDLSVLGVPTWHGLVPLS